MRPVIAILTLLISLFAWSTARAALILNEALANEPGTTTTLEWVEVLNWPDTGQAISLAGYKYVDGGQTVVLTSDVLIPPGGYAILARKATGSGSFEERWGDSSGTWGDHETESFSVITVTQISLRNSSDTVRLISPSGDTSMILWRSDAGDGISIERIRPGTNDDESNFASCKDASGSTSGQANSVLPPQGDLAIDTVIVGPESPNYGDTIHFAVRVRNVGFGDVDSSGVSLSRDRDPDFGTDSLIPISTQAFNGLSEDGDTAIVLDWTDCPPGKGYLVLKLDADADTANNSAKVSVIVRFTHPLIIISEYLANPEPGGPEEWVELANMTGHAIRTEGIRIGDSLNSEPIPPPHQEIPAFGFIVLAENASAFRAYYPSFEGTVVQIPGWRALNNSGDGIRLVGPSDEMIDSLSFRTVYDGNRSVERVELTPSIASPRDWTGSNDSLGATPGAPNSVIRGEPGALVVDSAWILSDDMSGGSRGIYASVTNIGFGPISPRILYIGLSLDPGAPDVINDTIGTVAIPEILESRTVVLKYLWQSPPPGVYRVVIWTTNDDGSPTDPPGVALTVVPYPSPLLIVSEYMAAPDPAGPGEWIELYNASAIPLPSGSVRIGDSSGVSTLPPPLTTIEPATFVVVTQDEDQFRAFYPDYGGDVRTLATWHTLGDNGDRIRLLGPTDEIIDSITYGARGEGSMSIERRQLVPDFADPRDWGVCVDVSGATPGRANSITRLSNDLALDSVIVSDQSPNYSNPVSVRAFVTNTGFAPSNGHGVQFNWIPESTDDLIFLMTELEPGDIVFRDANLVPPIPGIVTLAVALSQDEDNSNNRIEIPFAVRFTEPSFIISEFLANPDSPGPGEWVEIQNVSDFAISLNSCEIGDADGTAGWLGILHGLFVDPGEFVILAESRTDFMSYYPDYDGTLMPMGAWRPFNNEGDMIRLLGPSGEIIDSLTYAVVYDGNHSSERTTIAATFSNPEDWTISVDPSGATPGRANSVSAASAGAFQITVSPNPVFRSVGQTARIDFRLEIGESLTLEVFDRAGRSVRTIADNQPSATGYVEWDGTDDEGAALRPGPYILFARSEPSGSTEKKVIVIAP